MKSPPTTIAIVEDDPSLREILTTNPGWELTDTFPDAESALLPFQKIRPA
jgi:hypothetical protein